MNYPATIITGPQGSGKTTFGKDLMTAYKHPCYINFDLMFFVKTNDEDQTSTMNVDDFGWSKAGITKETDLIVIDEVTEGVSWEWFAHILHTNSMTINVQAKPSFSMRPPKFLFLTQLDSFPSEPWFDRLFKVKTMEDLDELPF